MNKAIKDDSKKIRMDLLPPDALREVAKVFTYGANKYSENNWVHGFEWHRLYAAAQRHLNAFWSGEDFDEVGNNHLASAGSNILMLLSHCLRNIGADDRPNKKKNNDKDKEQEFLDAIKDLSYIDLNRTGDSKLLVIGKYIVCYNKIPNKEMYTYDVYNPETNNIVLSFSNKKILNELEIIQEIENEINKKINNKEEVKKELTSKNENNEINTVKENNNNAQVSLNDSFELGKYIVSVVYTRNNKPFMKKEVYSYDIKSKDSVLQILFDSDKKLSNEELLARITEYHSNINENDKKKSIKKKSNNNQLQHPEKIKILAYNDGFNSYNIKMVKIKNKYKYEFNINNSEDTFYYNSNYELNMNDVINLINQRRELRHE